MKTWILVIVILAGIALIGSGFFSGRAPDAEPSSVHPPSGAPASSAVSGTLQITVVAPEGATGRVAFALYDREEAYAGKAEPLERGFVDVRSDGSATWRVAALDYGAYAVKAYHDANGNEELDKGAFGIPTEAYGFSRNARGRMGPPRFEDVRFTLDAPDLALEIRLSK